MRIKLNSPLNHNTVIKLKAGDMVHINGILYVARDAAHKKMHLLIREGKKLPFDINGQIIYYAGPCPAKPGQVIGSCGPTTSGRMDAYAPGLLDMGLKGMIGKGLRDKSVIDAVIRNKAVYFGATGGAGALISKSIIRQEIIAFDELGPEALRKIQVKDFPAVVVIDCKGNNLYEKGRKEFCLL